jgi:hypothetical protein
MRKGYRAPAGRHGPSMTVLFPGIPLQSVWHWVSEPTSFTDEKRGEARRDAMFAVLKKQCKENPCARHGMKRKLPSGPA